MAAYARSVFGLLSLESKAVFLGTRGSRPAVESRRYVRGLRRKPVNVLFPEDDNSKVTKQHSAPKQQQQHGKKMEKHTKGTKNTEEEVFVQERKGAQPAHTPDVIAHEEVAGLRFERAFPGDKRLSRVASVARSRTFREHQGKILLEGRRLISDALSAGAKPQMMFFSSVERLLELPVDKLKRASLVKVKFEDVKIWSDLVAPQGVIAIFSRPDSSKLKYNSDHSIPLSVICDNIRDPGNLGTIIRCAGAAGCHRVLLTKGCVDAWEPKVLRAAMGGHFRLPLFSNLDWEDIENHLPKSVTVHVADNSSNRLVESAQPKADELKTSQKAGDYGWVRTRSNHKHVDYDVCDSDSDGEYELSLPRVGTKLYHEHWAQSPTALVIGGETHGLSIESVQLAEKTAGHRLFIPVVPEVDSLNSAMAASILLFEGRKQLMQQLQTTKKSQVVNRMKQ
ncbi:rRNA methyltransferase 3A, mitochondrial [Eucyclogobius newberryi]|uniref:rRNA methyltransferase 3A, mitochondrial n=1 Tax=Eucyclogobius newberryi TaxID=166745 RepID=UPI003B5A9D50